MTDVTTMEPGVAYDLPGYPEPVKITTQLRGTAYGRECRAILQGAETGMHYCAHEGCPYSHAQWSSVFSHRAKHTKEEARGRGPLDMAAYTASLQSQLEKSQRENTHLRAQLAEAKHRVARLTKQVRAAKAAA